MPLHEKSSFGQFRGNPHFVSVNVARPSQEEQPAASSRPIVSEKPKVSKTALLFDVLISVSLVALFFGLPLFFTGVTFQGIAFEKQIYFYFWLLIGVVAWVSKGVIVGEMRIRRTPLDIPIVLFWLFYVAAAFFSVDRWHSFWGFFGDPSRGVISVTALVLAYYLLMSHFTEKRFYWMFGSFLASGLIVALWSSLVVMKIHFLPASWERFAPMSLIGTVSTLGLFLSLLVPLFLTLLFVLWKDDAPKTTRRMVYTGFAFLGLFLTLFLLLALYSYVPWIVVLVGLSFFMVYILAQIVRPSEQWTWVPMLVFVVVLAFLMIGKNSLARATLPIEVTPNTTLSWQVAKESLKEHFVAGVGPGNYGYAFSMYRPQEYNDSSLYTLRFYQGTGLFFEALPTVGVLGTILLLVLGFSFLSVGLYLLTHEKTRNKLFSLGLWTVALMFFVAGFVAAVNGTMLLLGVLLSALALAALLWESGSEERYLNLSLKAAPKFALALAFIFMVVSAGVAFLFVFMGKVFLADVAAGKAVRLSATAPQKDSVALLVSATQKYPQEGRYYTRLGQEYMALGNVEAAKNEADRDVQTVAAYARLAVVTAEQGRQRMPNDVMAAESLGLIYENSALYASDALPKAEELYVRSQELEPRNPLFSLKLGQIKKVMADREQDGPKKNEFLSAAKDLLQKSIDEKGNLAIAHYNMAVVLARMKDTDKAIEEAAKALSIDKNNINYKYNLGVLYQIRAVGDDEAKAEALFKDVLEKNERLIDVRLSLGLLYEKQKKNNDAVEQYEKIFSFLPDDAEGNVKQTKEQIEKLIGNVRSGVGNLTPRTNPQAATPAPELPQQPTPVTSTQPNASPLAPENGQ